MNVIDFNGVSEKYRIKFIRQKKVCWEEVWALKDINFQAKKGDIIGIIGKNGAGKTTLLKLIAGMLVPDKGEVHIEGKVSALMELGAGFSPEFTGIENIKLNAAIYGLSEENLRQRMDSIIKFANLGKFIDAPIKYYSQGMYMRLAFALAIFVEPDILLIDDILAVGDEEAQQKCVKKIFELKQTGKTVILVSHNMDVISRLCSRIILLEKGRIIQENLTAKVVPYYLETVGDEKGIAVLEKGQFRIIFNNGKVFLNYNGLPLTKATGGYASFFSPSFNSWFSSLNLFWQIKNLEADKFIAEGKSHEGVLSQTWMFQIEKNCFKWQIEINDKASKQQHVDLLLTPQYKRWETQNRNGDFPFFTSKSNWHDLGLNSSADDILGLSASWQGQNCPGLVLEQEDRQNIFKIFNTGYEQEARVIQWSLSPENKNLISIKLFSEEDKFAEYIENVKQSFMKKQEEEKQRLLKKQEEEKQRLLKKQEEEKQRLLKKQEEEKQRLLAEQQREQARLRAQRTISQGNLRLYADVENKALRLFYKDKEITIGRGMNSSFLLKTDWYDLSFGQWQLEKVSDEELVLSVNYERFSMSQVWILICQKDALIIKAETKFNKLILSPNQLVRLCLCSEYQKWESAYEYGNFLNEQYIGDVAPVRLKDNKVTEILFKPENKEDAPELLFSVFSQPERRTMNIHRCKQGDEKELRVDSSLIVHSKEKLTGLDSVTCFEGKIVLGKKLNIKKNTRKVSSVKLADNNLEFIFNQGRGEISLSGNKLTSGLGVYTSIRSSGVWYDSYQAFWMVDWKKNNELKVTGYWPHIAVSQVWHINMPGDNLILWQVDMEVSQQLNFEICQANIMLCPKYKKWMVSHYAHGDFLDEYTKEYDILPFRFWYGRAKEITAKANILPEVCFKNGMEKSDMLAIIENTDNLYQARLLQYQKVNIHKIPPGRHLYFKGRIKITG